MPWGRSASVVKKTYGYQERDEIKRQEFQLSMRTKNPHQIVYVDEAGLNPGIIHSRSKNSLSMS